MSVRYNRLLGIAFLILGGINLLMGGWLNMLEGRINGSLVLGAVLFFLAILYLTRVYFTVAPDAIVMSAMIGPLKRTFPYTTLKMVDKKIFAEHNGETKRIPVNRWMSHRADWEAFLGRVVR